MQHITNSVHVDQMAFNAEIDGHTLRFDGASGNTGPRPKAIMLNSLAICSGFDIVTILEKMKLEYSDLSIQTTGDLSESQPSVYTKIHMEFKVKIAPENHAKFERAVQLSTEKYCGVYAMLIKVCPITQGITYL